MKLSNKNKFFYLLLFFSIGFGKSDFESRTDSWFSPIKSFVWDKGFYLTPGITYGINNPLATTTMKGAFGYTLRKRTDFLKMSFIINLLDVNFLGRLNEEKYYVGIGVHSDLLIYRNGGKFVKNMGTVAPFFGLFFGESHYYESTPEVLAFFIKGGFCGGVEYLFLPPYLSIRFMGRFFAEKKITDKEGSESGSLLLNVSLEAGLCVYLF